MSIQKQKRTNTKKTSLRVLLFLCCVLFVFIAPWWVAFTVSISLLMYYRWYEMVVIGLMLDALFTVPEYFYFKTAFPFTALLLVCISVVWFLSLYIGGTHNSQYA